MTAPHALLTITSLTATTIEHVRETEGALRTLHLEMAERPSLAESRDSERGDLLARRRALLLELGGALIDWMALGGTLALRPPPRGCDEPLAEDEDTEDAAPLSSDTESSPPAPEVASTTTLIAPDLSALMVHFDQGDHIAFQATPPIANRAGLRPLLSALGPLPPARGGPGEGAVGCLTKASKRLDVLADQPSGTQQEVLSLLVARARALQERLAADDAHHPKLERVFSRLTRWVGAHNTPFVHGLARHHVPQHGSWHEDARVWTRRLEERRGVEPTTPPTVLLAAVRGALDGDTAALQRAVHGALKGGISSRDPRLVGLLQGRLSQLDAPCFKALRRVLRDREKQAAPPCPEAPALPADWSHFAHTRGRRAVLLGGDPRSEALERLKTSFGFASLTWERIDPRRLESIATSVAAGSLDLVIVLRRFISHDVDRVVLPACKRAGVAWVSVEHGYGVSQVRAAIERYLG